MWGGISFSVDLLFYFESTTSEHKLKLKLKQKCLSRWVHEFCNFLVS